MRQAEKVELIKSSVTLRDVLNAYGYDGDNRRGRIACPLHSGNNKDAFSFNDNVFQCWNCGAKGDLIAFVMQHDSVGFNSALVRLNEMFHLWEEDKPLSINQKKKIKAEKFKRKMAKLEKEHINDEFDAIRDELHRLDANLIRYAPKSPDEEPDERFVEACHKISYQEYLSEIAIRR